MKENNKIIKSNLKTLLKRYSRTDAVANLERNYTQEAVHKIDPKLIKDTKYLSKVIVSDQEVDEISNDMKEGSYQPFIVRPVNDGYEIILGRHYLRAAKKLKFDTVNCLVQQIGDEEALLIMASYNRDRKSTNVVEEAYICSYLKKDFDYKNKDLSILFRQSPSQISNVLQLLKLDHSVLNLIIRGQISYGHAKAFCRLDEDKVDYVFESILDEHLSVRETERLVHSLITQSVIDKNIIVTRNKITLIFKEESDKAEALDQINKLIAKNKINL